MSVKLDDVVAVIEQIAPKELAYDWDNTGLLLRCAGEVNSVLIALDVTQVVVDEAIEQGCDMILAHHPTVFDPMRSLSIDAATDAVIMRMIGAGISLYAAHTSYDRATGGMNDVLAKRLGLENVCTANSDDNGLMRIGQLPKRMDRAAFADHVKAALGIKYLKTSHGTCDSISRVAVVGGSGGDFIAAAKKEGMDALVTGEAKHHHYLEAAALGVLLVEAGHYDTERWFVDDVFMSLQSRLNEVQLYLGLKRATCESVPYKYR